MSYPPGMPLVNIVIGNTYHLETSSPLDFRVKVKAVSAGSNEKFPGLVWLATGDRYSSFPVNRRIRLRGSAEISLPATNVEGWGTYEGTPIEVEDGALHTHAYEFRLTVLENGATVSSEIISPVFLPEGSPDPVDLDTLISVPHDSGYTINIPRMVVTISDDYVLTIGE